MDKSSLNKGRYALDGRKVFEFATEQEAEEYRKVVKGIDRGFLQSSVMLYAMGSLLFVLGWLFPTPPGLNFWKIVAGLPIFLCLIPTLKLFPLLSVRREMKQRATCHEYRRKDLLK